MSAQASNDGGSAKRSRAVRSVARACLVALLTVSTEVDAQPRETASQPPQTWATAWAASVQGPYPVGNATVQPDLKLAFPLAELGARNQSFRLIVRPDVWGRQLRIRLSNALGTRPVTFDDVFVGLQLSGSAVMKGTSVPVTFRGARGLTIGPGSDAWSDAIDVPFVPSGEVALLAGRKLAVSFHVAGDSGPMTWHAKALTTSYVTLPGAGSHGGDEQEQAFPASTTSWFFLDAIDVLTSTVTHTIVAFGDSITDGTASTLNGDDRWPDVLSRRLHARYGDAVSVVNAGIGGNRVAGPAAYTPQQPFSGGPSAVQRLHRDVLSLTGVSSVIWLEGINDFGVTVGTSVDAVQQSMRAVVSQLHEKGIRVFGATLTSAVGNGSAADSLAREVKRQMLNAFIRTSDVFDGVFDFDRATSDPVTGAMRDAFIPNSTDGGPGDHLHPNRQGYAAMADAIEIEKLVNW